MDGNGEVGGSAPRLPERSNEARERGVIAPTLGSRVYRALAGTRIAVLHDEPRWACPACDRGRDATGQPEHQSKAVEIGRVLPAQRDVPRRKHRGGGGGTERLCKERADPSLCRRRIGRGRALAEGTPHAASERRVRRTGIVRGCHRRLRFRPQRSRSPGWKEYPLRNSSALIIARPSRCTSFTSTDFSPHAMRRQSPDASSTSPGSPDPFATEVR